MPKGMMTKHLLRPSGFIGSTDQPMDNALLLGSDVIGISNTLATRPLLYSTKYTKSVDVDSPEPALTMTPAEVFVRYNEPGLQGIDVPHEILHHTRDECRGPLRNG